MIKKLFKILAIVPFLLSCSNNKKDIRTIINKLNKEAEIEINQDYWLTGNDEYIINNYSRSLFDKTCNNKKHHIRNEAQYKNMPFKNTYGLSKEEEHVPFTILNQSIECHKGYPGYSDLVSVTPEEIDTYSNFVFGINLSIGYGLNDKIIREIEGPFKINFKILFHGYLWFERPIPKTINIEDNYDDYRLEEINKEKYVVNSSVGELEFTDYQFSHHDTWSYYLSLDNFTSADFPSTILSTHGFSIIIAANINDSPFYSCKCYRLYYQEMMPVLIQTSPIGFTMDEISLRRDDIYGCVALNYMNHTVID